MRVLQPFVVQRFRLDGGRFVGGRLVVVVASESGEGNVGELNPFSGQAGFARSGRNRFLQPFRKIFGNIVVRLSTAPGQPLGEVVGVRLVDSDRRAAGRLVDRRAACRRPHRAASAQPGVGV